MMTTYTSFRVGAKTDKGLVRSGNEDTFTVNTNLEKRVWQAPDANEALSTQTKGALFVVADGMGGTKGGEIAAKLAIEAVEDYFNALPSVNFRIDFFQSHLNSALLAAHQSILNRIKRESDLKDMGTTCSIAWLFQDHLFISWVGDSRIYLHRPNANLIALSKDHSYVQELIDAKRITESEAFTHPDKNIITQSLGDTSRPPKPSFDKFVVQEQDRILLCSDGLNTMVRDFDIERILSKNEPSTYTVSDLIELANKNGGGDNITVVVCDVVALPNQNDRLSFTEALPLANPNATNFSVANNTAEPKSNAGNKNLLFIGLCLVLAGLISYMVYEYLIKKPLIPLPPPNTTNSTPETTTTPLVTPPQANNSGSLSEQESSNYALTSTTIVPTKPPSVIAEPKTPKKPSVKPVTPSTHVQQHGQTPPLPTPATPTPTTESTVDNKGSGTDIAGTTKAKIKDITLQGDKFYLILGSETKKQDCEDDIKKRKTNGGGVYFIGVCPSNSNKFYVLASSQAYDDLAKAKADAAKVGAKSYLPCE